LSNPGSLLAERKIAGQVRRHDVCRVQNRQPLQISGAAVLAGQPRRIGVQSIALIFQIWPKAATACFNRNQQTRVFMQSTVWIVLASTIQTVPSSFSLRSQQPCVSQWSTAGTYGQSKLPASTIVVTEVQALDAGTVAIRTAVQLLLQ
jgi:hypothetical protein